MFRGRGGRAAGEGAWRAGETGGAARRGRARAPVEKGFCAERGGRSGRRSCGGSLAPLPGSSGPGWALRAPRRGLGSGQGAFSPLGLLRCPNSPHAPFSRSPQPPSPDAGPSRPLGSFHVWAQPPRRRLPAGRAFLPRAALGAPPPPPRALAPPPAAPTEGPGTPASRCDHASTRPQADHGTCSATDRPAVDRPPLRREPGGARTCARTRPPARAARTSRLRRPPLGSFPARAGSENNFQALFSRVYRFHTISSPGILWCLEMSLTHRLGFLSSELPVAPRSPWVSSKPWNCKCWN